MKALFVLLSIALTSPAFADQPSFVCKEQSGFMYLFFSDSFNEIQVLDENSNLVDSIDGISMKYRSIESLPSVEQYTFLDSDTGNEIAVVEFRDGQANGTGSMTDNDQEMVCTR